MSLLLVVLLLALPGPQEDPVVVGSKNFTENVILGELATMLVRDAGIEARHRRELGGTRILFEALERGDLDLYPDYTGTLREEILSSEELADDAALARSLETRGLRLSPPLGFNNTYALGMRRAHAEKLGITRISDLAAHPDLRFGFGNEFLDRADGWPGLQTRYGWAPEDVRGLDHDLAYQGLAAGSLDVVDVYSTDAEIAALDLAVLEDDRGWFPRYDAVFVYRADLAERHPQALASLFRLAGRLPEADMVALNASVRIDEVPDQEAAADFLRRTLNVQAVVTVESFWGRFRRHARDHLFLVAVSLAAAALLAVPLGILAARHAVLGQALLGVAGILQTIPSLALLVVMIPLFGIGNLPTVVALFLYSLLPILRNTHAGLTGIAPELRESAAALGLSAGARLRHVELPLAMPMILAGLQTSAVINVGTATLGALAGAGGFGQPILTGIRLADTARILEGAVPAALLALVVQSAFEMARPLLVPRGLRLRKEG